MTNALFNLFDKNNDEYINDLTLVQINERMGWQEIVMTAQDMGHKYIIEGANEAGEQAVEQMSELCIFNSDNGIVDFFRVAV